MQSEAQAQDARKARLSQAMGNMGVMNSSTTTCTSAGGVLTCNTF